MKVNRGEVYILPAKDAIPLTEGLKKNGHTDSFAMIRLMDVIVPFEYGDKENLFIMRPGAIGDVIAISCLRNLMPDKVFLFITNLDQYPVLDWWQLPPQYVRTYKEPLFTKVDLVAWAGILKYTHGYSWGGEVENGSHQNWYEIIFKVIAMNNPSPELCRPFLRKDRISKTPSSIQKIQKEFDYSVKSILLCPRASSNMRCISFEDLFNSVKPLAKDSLLFVHEKNLTNQDKLFIYMIRDLCICIISAPTVAEFFLDCYDADLVISVDTAAIHFREGIEKPAIAIYASFESQARCKYYKFVKCIDIKSHCRLQPCFLHDDRKNETCEIQKEIKTLESSAPCLNSAYNLSLKEQLDNELPELINSIL